MGCGANEVKNLDFCEICICTTKKCMYCSESKTLGLFERDPTELNGRENICLQCKESKGE